MKLQLLAAVMMVISGFYTFELPDRMNGELNATWLSLIHKQANYKIQLEQCENLFPKAGLEPFDRPKRDVQSYSAVRSKRSPNPAPDNDVGISYNFIDKDDSANVIPEFHGYLPASFYLTNHGNAVASIVAGVTRNKTCDYCGAGVAFDSELVGHDTLGFGYPNALKMVKKAKEWTPLPPVYNVSDHQEHDVTKGDKCLMHFNVVKKRPSVTQIEEMIVDVWTKMPRNERFNLKITSPCGTESVLMDNLVRNTPTAHFINAHVTFLTYAFWGENSFGEWTLEMDVKGEKSYSPCHLGSADITFFGTIEERVKPNSCYVTVILNL
ncbi:FUR2-like protein [Mya arenaria]|uniref:FUR2-like protein n=1 Tax=Mya arenaria TaxID=6604 RepID=A0ABY7EQ88_MYAAR|nr:FUR2-like protein [Mya arenaria]